MMKRFCLVSMGAAMALLFSVLGANVYAQKVDFSRAELMISATIRSPVKENAERVFQEEIFRRTNLKINSTTHLRKNPLFIFAKNTDEQVNGIKVPQRVGAQYPENKPEGYRILAERKDGKDILWLIAGDDRAVTFAMGDFLRKADLSKNKIIFDQANESATAPVYPYRGHQLGYRNTANSWDAWTVEQFDEYIRELAFFGTNSIENIPFQDKPSPLMKVSREKMNIEMSKICDNYDIDYRIWTPGVVDLSDSKNLEEEVKMHSEFYKECPRLDAVFFPGGDPGHNHPKYVMPFMKRLAEELKKYHPEAELWISLQGFSEEQVDYFYGYLKKYSPDWLTGVTTGPGSPGVAETRHRLPEKYKHTLYPDITHTVRCDFPVLNWDQAFALTEGREVSNPQPYYYTNIFLKLAPFTEGFVSYSDGVHDDVNKILWSRLAWNPEEQVSEILKEYTHLFFGHEASEAAANGIVALENNWDGAIEENGQIATTFKLWEDLENRHPELKENWRWQLLLLRSYYDYYTAKRKVYEQALETRANKILLEAPAIGVDKSVQEALKIVNLADEEQVVPEVRQHVVDLCEDLFQSIGLQTSVEKYQAKNPERGAVLDFLDYPLNNRWWLADEFEKIKNYSSEEKKLDRLKVIATWTNPGPGSYYDDISNIAQQKHVQSGSYDATDVAWWDDGMSRERLSTQLFQNFPRLEYDDLDPKAHYKIRISGEGDALIRVNGERLEPILYNKGLGEFKEFLVPSRLIRTGKIKISFDEPEESQVNWRQQSKVSDLWLLKVPMIID